MSARRDVLTWGEEALRVSHCDVASSQHHVLEDGQGAIVGDVEADVPGGSGSRNGFCTRARIDSIDSGCSGSFDPFVFLLNDLLL